MIVPQEGTLLITTEFGKVRILSIFIEQNNLFYEMCYSIVIFLLLHASNYYPSNFFFFSSSFLLLTLIHITQVKLLNFYPLSAAGIFTFSHLFHGASLHVHLFKSYTIVSPFRVMSFCKKFYDFISHHIISSHIISYQNILHNYRCK